MTKTIVILSNIEWGFLKQRHQFLAENLYKLGYKVIFVESAAKRNPSLKDIPRLFSRLRKVFLKTKTPINSGNIAVITPVVFPSTFRIFRILNNYTLVKRLSKIIIDRTEGDENLGIIAYTPSSTTLQLLKYLKPKISIYDCVSNFEAFTEMPRDTVKIEKQLISLVDYVTVDCDYLFNKHKQKSKSITLIEPAVNYNHFNEPFKSLQIKKINRIVYFGYLDKIKSNISLINYLAESGFDITVIGTVEEPTLLSEKVNQISTVSYDVLPNRLVKFDAILLPYNINDVTEGIIPAKFFECFATGLPIIATELPNFIRYKDLFINGSTFEEIVTNIKLLDIKSEIYKSEIRRNIAKSKSWDNFAIEFEKILKSKDGIF